MTNNELQVPRGIMEEEHFMSPDEASLDSPPRKRTREDTLQPVEELPNINNNQRRKRTREDFYLFCTYILKYVNYNPKDSQQNEELNGNRSPPPLDSSGSSVNSESTNSGHEDKPSGDETDNDGADSHDLVTCYCGKPFAGRPMIECSLCLTWIHLSCARIRKTHIPEVFYCAVCKSRQQQQSPPSSPSSLKRFKRGSMSPM